MPGEAQLLAYVLVFAAAAIACFGSVPRAGAIEDPETRRGLVWLLVTSGGWATAHVAFLLAPTRDLKVAAYVAGLVVGLATVGPWLYFCSAYSGRSLHRHPTVRTLAVGAFALVVLVKLTNPWHSLYFTGELTADPFWHLAITNGVVHWLVMGVSYALAAIGYFMLLELFAKVSQDTRPLVVLVGLTGLPVLLDVVGYASPLLVDIGYEPLGVAVFAVGVLYGYTEQFQAIRLAGSREGPVVVVSDADRVREVNDGAIDLFPALENDDVIGRPLDQVLPGLAHAVDAEESILTIERDGSKRYYRITESPFTGGGNASLGRLLTLTDVTHRERYRRELERQNDRLNQFAEMVSHDLRNPLTVANGQLEVARERLGDDDSLDEIAAAHERIETIIENVLALARQGQPIDETEPVSLSGIATDCWGMVDTSDHLIEIEDDYTFDADADRLRSLFENLFRNAVEHGSTSPRSQAPDDAIEHGDGEATVTVGALADGDGFFVADDGPGIPEADRESVFESGFTTAAEGTGFGLAIVKEVVDAHGWTIGVTESESGGARFEVRGVTPAA